MFGGGSKIKLDKDLLEQLRPQLESILGGEYSRKSLTDAGMCATGSVWRQFRASLLHGLQFGR